MPLFQNSVLNHYLKLQDDNQIDNAYKKFSSYFHNTTIQENIRSCKEEQFQATFLNELFVKVLGYNLNPQPNYNLTTEYKNQNNARKADGAILRNGDAIGVIELKGSNTKHLEGIRKQAFDYKVNQRNCTYVITSNFEKLRFYIGDATEFEEFDLFRLSRHDFSLLFLCLHKENIFNNIPLSIKKASIVEEEEITHSFYNEYSRFKRELFRDLVKRNAKRLKNHKFNSTEGGAEYENNELNDLEKNIKLSLFKKSQKLIDRFLFIFFAEDRDLLPPNSANKILTDWNRLLELDAHIPLYDRFIQYFNYLDQGRKSQDGQQEIFAYNGGLFRTDQVLDSLEIDDHLLYTHVGALAKYDFNSQVDVSILGHIFENSLNEIESVNAQITGDEFEKQKSKRKKDGVYYTPRYITKYIVKNTVGKLCEEKKSSLGFREEEYFRGRKRRHENTIENLLNILETYRKWLLKLTICDPACGSGAFLNEALDFLIKEHQYLDDLKSRLLGGGLSFPDIESTVLENNIYGVDINEESVEIAKLSLWLRTAQPRRKLNDLSNNIKCGNSLIKSKTLAGKKAFNWRLEFPEIFQNGGFDVIIGNPPYGARLPKSMQSYLNQHYIKGGSETAISFLKLSHEVLKSGGEFGFIIPKSFAYSSNYQSIREFLLDDISEIADCGKVWSNVKLEQVIVRFKKAINSDVFSSCIRRDQEIISLGCISKTTFEEFGFLLNGISKEELTIGRKIKGSGGFLKDIGKNQRGGALQKFIKDSGEVKVLAGANVQREGVEGFKGFASSEKVNSECKNIVKKNSVLVQNIVSHINNPVEHIKITACVPPAEFQESVAILDTINQISLSENIDPEIIAELLNSKVINWYCFRFIYGKAIRTMHFDNSVTDRIPLPVFGIDKRKKLQILIERKKDLQINLNNLKKEFQDYLNSFYFDGGEVPKKVQQWEKLSPKKFVKLIVLHTKDSITTDGEFELFKLFQKQNEKLKILQKDHELTSQSIEIEFLSLFNLNQKEIDILTNQMP